MNSRSYCDKFIYMNDKPPHIFKQFELLHFYHVTHTNSSFYINYLTHNYNINGNRQWRTICATIVSCETHTLVSPEAEDIRPNGLEYIGIHFDAELESGINIHHNLSTIYPPAGLLAYPGIFRMVERRFDINVK